MTPESLIGVFDLLDRWRLMLLQMQGQMPELPALPGRQHRAPRIPEGDPGAEQIERELRAARIWRELADEGSNCD